MDSMEFTKIAGAVMAAGIVALLAGFIAEEVYRKPALEAHAYMAESGDEAEAEDTASGSEPEPTGMVALLASADLAAGQKAMKKCTACHSLEKGAKHKNGPNLWDVVNRGVGAAEGFAYSKALQGMSSESWSYDNLDAFLAKPKDWAPGTKMSFAGLKKPEQRAALIAFLRTLSDNPAALPE